MFSEPFEEDINAMSTVFKSILKPKVTTLRSVEEKSVQFAEDIESAPLRKSSFESGSEASSTAETVVDNNSLSKTTESTHSSTRNARIVSDAIIGLSDGLTVPFALTAGLSALGNARVVVFGGLAELIAGAISMGLGGYLGAKAEEDSYRHTQRTTLDQIRTAPDEVTDSIAEVFKPYDLPAPLLKDLTNIISNRPSFEVLEFLMQFQHNASEPATSRAWICALTIAMGYFIGGFVPLIPYFFTSTVFEGLMWSIGVMAVALFTFGYVKTCVLEGWQSKSCVTKGLWSGVQMILIGGAAAGAAMSVVRLFEGQFSE